MTAAFAGAAQTLEVPGWLYMVVTLLGSGVLFRFFMVRTEKRLSEAGATKTEAEAQEIEDRVRRALSEEMESSLRRQREETVRAQAGEKEAIAEVAKLVAHHARDRAEWKVERHDFINQVQARDNQIAMLRIENTEMRGEIKELRTEVQTLRVALGVEQGRRIDDDRLTHLEHRADVSESDMSTEQDRNTKIEKRADRAEKIADEQAHRNDDTPGHA